MEDNYFKILWWFLPYINMNQPWVHVFCHPELPSRPPPHPVSLGFPEYWLWVPFFMHRTCTGHLENDDFSVENLPDQHCLIQVVTVSITGDVRVMECTLDRVLWKQHFTSVIWFPQTQNMNVIWLKKKIRKIPIDRCVHLPGLP